MCLSIWQPVLLLLRFRNVGCACVDCLAIAFLLCIIPVDVLYTEADKFFEDNVGQCNRLQTAPLQFFIIILV